MELSGERRFELKRQLADTLQGRIYSAIDKQTNEWVVVKETWKQLVRLGKSRDGHAVPENFDEEKRIMKYLSMQKDAHDGFVRLIDEWEDKDCYLYAMEMCRGGELFEYVKQTHNGTGALKRYTQRQAMAHQEEMKGNNEWIKRVQHMFRQVASCTAWMHKKGVCHLDMSLENAMIGARTQMTIKIIDFGLARHYPNNEFVCNKRVGKRGYMAPEVFAGKSYDPRAADIWSLGVMLFMMLIGAPPYGAPLSSNPAFNFIVNGRLRDVLKHWKRLGMVNKPVLDLLNRIFKYEKDRITMDELLQHPFVRVADEKSEKQAQAATSTTTGTTEHNNQQQQPQQPPAQEPSVSETPTRPVKKEEPAEEEQQDPQETDALNQQSEQANVVRENEKEQENKAPVRSDIAKKFAKKLSTANNDSHGLNEILKEIEQTVNSLQQKLRLQTDNQHHSHDNHDNPNAPEPNLQQSIKELEYIQSTVEQKLESMVSSNKANKGKSFNCHDQCTCL